MWPEIYAPKELRWSARDIILVHECPRLPTTPTSQRALLPMSDLEWRCCFQRTMLNQRIHELLFVERALLTYKPDKNSRAYYSGTIARLTTYVRVMHLRSYVLTRNTMCNVWHNSVVHLFARNSVCCAVCVEKNEMKVGVRGFHAREEQKMSCACDCGRGPVFCRRVLPDRDARGTANQRGQNSIDIIFHVQGPRQWSRTATPQRKNTKRSEWLLGAENTWQTTNCKFAA